MILMITCKLEIANVLRKFNIKQFLFGYKNILERQVMTISLKRPIYRVGEVIRAQLLHTLYLILYLLKMVLSSNDTILVKFITKITFLC